MFLIVQSCLKQDEDLPPRVFTTAVSEITQTSAKVFAEVNLSTKYTTTEEGFFYGSDKNPDKNGNKVTYNGSGVSDFDLILTGLNPNTDYYVCAYVKTSLGFHYGNILSFTTSPALLPTLTTTNVTSITSTSALTGGSITDDGGDNVTALGVCWATTPNPTTANSKTVDGTGTGNFISSITGLEPGTTYYVRAYAINVAGTAYGNELTFKTIEPTVPVLTTALATNITSNSAQSGGDISSDGGAPVIARGVCWGTNQDPTISNSKTSNGAGTGNFASNITGLNQGTTYYIRAYATNSVGTAYGNQISFLTDTETITDADGNEYQTITIGTQVWMAENLKTTSYNDGSSIPNVTDIPTWWNLTTPAYCWYENNSSFKTPFGGLYNWFAVQTGKLCPTGWHVPTKENWETLSNFLGGSLVAGGKLKEAGLTNWDSPNTGATNETGFSAVPGGMHDWDKFMSMGNLCLYWTSSERDPTTSYTFNLMSTTAWLQGAHQTNQIGYSVRCIKD